MDSLVKARPFQVILMVIFGLLALLGVYVFANYTGFGGGGTKVGALVIWGTLPQAAMTQELAALSTADKTYSKVTYVQEQASTFDNDLANAIASGDGPDLIIISQEQLLGEEGKINVIPFSSISQRTFLNTYLPEDQLYLTTTGTYGIPFVLDPLVLYYNQTLLSQAGIAQPPTSWEAVTGLAPSLTLKDATQVITQSAIAFGAYTNIENARAILSLLFLQAGSTITQSSADQGLRSTLAQGASNSSTGIGPATAALNFYTQFSDPTRTVYTWNASFPSARQAFLAGNLALYVGFASEEPFLKASNPNLSFDMAAIPQPQTSTTKADYGLAYAFAIPKASKNQVGAYMTATALSSTSQLPAVSEALSMAPANRSILTAPASDAYAPIYYPAALISSGWLSPPPTTTDSIFSAMITSVNSGQLEARDAIDAADEAIDSVLPSSST